MRRVRFLDLLLALPLALLLAACSGNTTPPPAGADLSGFATARITINGVPFEVWLAETPTQQQTGLMFATAAQLAPLSDGTERGMLFVFPDSGLLAFFMRDTFIPLDLAYARSDGTIVEVHDLVPLDETPVVSGEAVRFALEVPAGTLAGHGLGPGDVIAIPPGIAD